MIALAAHDMWGATSQDTNVPKTFEDVFDVRFLDEQIILQTSTLQPLEGFCPMQLHASRFFNPLARGRDCQPEITLE